MRIDYKDIYFLTAGCDVVFRGSFADPLDRAADLAVERALIVVVAHCHQSSQSRRTKEGADEEGHRKEWLRLLDGS